MVLVDDPPSKDKRACAFQTCTQTQNLFIKCTAYEYRFLGGEGTQYATFGR
jgi:hypothetical protein